VKRSLAAFAAPVLFACMMSPAQAQEWKPGKNVEIVVSSGAGGASDRQARVTQRFFQTLPGMPSVTVNNRPGGGGAVALTTLTQHPADGHYMYVMQTGILANHIVGASTVSYQDLTPLATLMHEHIAVWVRADSQIASAKDLMERLRRDPAVVSFGFSGTRGNQNHIMIGLLSRAAGADLKAVKSVVYNNPGQGIAATLGGHIDVWVGSAASVVPHLESGAARAIGIGALQRQPAGLAVVPTFREQGIDAVYADTRGFIGPKALPQPQVDYWDRAFARLVEDDMWKKELEKYLWAPDYRNAAETRKRLDAEYQLLTRLLGELGLKR
jgi:putative tricarboxylic transport membrane protein